MANRDESNLRNHCVEYSYLFNVLTTGQHTAAKFKNNVREQRPYSIYANTSNRIGPANVLINDLLSMPQFATGDCAKAFDFLFGTAVGKAVEVGFEQLRTALTQKLGQKAYTDEQLNCFLDFVSYTPEIHCFTKVKFAAAMRYMTVVLRPDIANNHFKDKVPGMMGYQSSAVQIPSMQPQIPGQPGLQQNVGMPGQQPGLQQPGMPGQPLPGQPGYNPAAGMPGQ